MLHEAAFGENTPLGSPLYPANVQAVDPQKVISFRDSKFIAKNIVVTASGIPHDDLKQVVEFHLHGLPNVEVAKLDDSPFVGGEIRVKADFNGGTYLGLGFPVPALDDGKRSARNNPL